MNKAFTKETDNDADDDGSELPGQALSTGISGSKNYITPLGYARLRGELFELIDTERPKIVDVVHWAASNGDRSENGDYLYGKKRLREIDRRIRFLTKRLEIAVVSDPALHHGSDQVFFGATVTYVNDAGTERTVTIMGIDEADSLQQQVSWISPIARALLKARVGEELRLATPVGVELIEVLGVVYPPPGHPAAPAASGCNRIRTGTANRQHRGRAAEVAQGSVQVGQITHGDQKAQFGHTDCNKSN